MIMIACDSAPVSCGPTPTTWQGNKQVRKLRNWDKSVRNPNLYTAAQFHTFSYCGRYPFIPTEEWHHRARTEGKRPGLRTVADFSSIPTTVHVPIPHIHLLLSLSTISRAALPCLHGTGRFHCPYPRSVDIQIQNILAQTP